MQTVFSHVMRKRYSQEGDRLLLQGAPLSRGLLAWALPRPATTSNTLWR